MKKTTTGATPEGLSHAAAIACEEAARQVMELTADRMRRLGVRSPHPIIREHRARILERAAGIVLAADLTTPQGVKDGCEAFDRMIENVLEDHIAEMTT